MVVSERALSDQTNPGIWWMVLVADYPTVFSFLPHLKFSALTIKGLKGDMLAFLASLAATSRACGAILAET